MTGVDDAARPDDEERQRFTGDLVRWSEALAAIARTGLGFTENLYERERFTEVLNVAADIKAAANEALEDIEVVPRAGPLRAGVAGVGRRRRPGLRHAEGGDRRRVGNDDGELLLVQRADSGSGSTRPVGPTSATHPPRWR